MMDPSRSVKSVPILICMCLLISSTHACIFENPQGHDIDQEVFINTDDTQLFAHIRGADSLAPILLYLHGGPGSPMGVPILKAYAGPELAKHFILVYLHQRGIPAEQRAV